MTERPDRPVRQLHRRLRRADRLLQEAERALHDLPDHLCPTDLLMRIRLHNASRAAAAKEPTTMHESIIVFGPTGCGKTLNAVSIARHFGLARILDDQNPFALPPGVATDTLILTSTDLRGRTELAGCRVLPYQDAATEAGVFAPVCQCMGD